MRPDSNRFPLGMKQDFERLWKFRVLIRKGVLLVLNLKMKTPGFFFRFYIRIEFSSNQFSYYVLFKVCERLLKFFKSLHIPHLQKQFKRRDERMIYKFNLG